MSVLLGSQHSRRIKLLPGSLNYPWKSPEVLASILLCFHILEKLITSPSLTTSFHPPPVLHLYPVTAKATAAAETVAQNRSREARREAGGGHWAAKVGEEAGRAGRAEEAAQRTGHYLLGTPRRPSKFGRQLSLPIFPFGGSFEEEFSPRHTLTRAPASLLRPPKPVFVGSCHRWRPQTSSALSSRHLELPTPYTLGPALLDSAEWCLEPPRVCRYQGHPSVLSCEVGVAVCSRQVERLNI